MDRIILNNLTLKFDKVLLDCVSYTFENNNYIILGNNGSGKTTLLRAITNNAPIYSGEITTNKTTVSYFPQEVLLFQYLKVREFILSVNKSIDSKLINMLDIFFEEEYIKNLSTGQVNKVLIYLTLSQKADFYIFDELINAIDNTTKNNIVLYLKQNLKGNFILVSHENSLLDLIKNNIECKTITIFDKQINLSSF